MGTLLRRGPAWANVAAVATGLLLLAYGLGFAGYVGYDSLFALTWGDELAHGHSPSIGGPFSPTPHPLLDALAVLLSPLGLGASRGALELLSLVAMALLAAGAYRLGAALFSRAAGALFAAILLTRPEIVELAMYSSFDVPFLALSIWAAALEAEQPRRTWAPLVLLALAGLLRPEAWILAAAYGLYLRRREPLVVALVAAAPVLWALHDLLTTGDPLFSFHGTRAVAELAPRDSGLGAALSALPDYLVDLLGVAVAVAGVAGWLLVPARLQRRVALPAALFGLSVVPFLAYGVAGLTLYPRFLLPAAAALALLCAAAATLYGTGDPDRLRKLTAAAVAVALLVSIPATVGQLADVRSGSETRARLEADLEELLSQHRDAIGDGCRTVHVQSRRLVPPLSRQLGIPKERFSLVQAASPSTLYVAVAPQSTRTYVVDPLRPDPVPRFTSPPDARTIAADASWSLSASC